MGLGGRPRTPANETTIETSRTSRALLAAWTSSGGLHGAGPAVTIAGWPDPPRPGEPRFRSYGVTDDGAWRTRTQRCRIWREQIGHPSGFEARSDRPDLSLRAPTQCQCRYPFSARTHNSLYPGDTRQVVTASFGIEAMSPAATSSVEPLSISIVAVPSRTRITSLPGRVHRKGSGVTPGTHRQSPASMPAPLHSTCTSPGVSVSGSHSPADAFDKNTPGATSISVPLPPGRIEGARYARGKTAMSNSSSQGRDPSTARSKPSMSLTGKVSVTLSKTIRDGGRHHRTSILFAVEWGQVAGLAGDDEYVTGL